ncbi:TPA: 50S ribosomal protein L23 [bacterium]|nr:50S ribosomal protein L23 [bacterium]
MFPEYIVYEPILTEKSYYLRKQNKYVFLVNPKANKIEIKKAVESVFNVKVASVNTMNVHGKPTRRRMIEGKKPDTKKAIVKLAEGQSIGIFEGI